MSPPEIVLAVRVVDEYGGAIHAALRDVQRDTGECQARTAMHRAGDGMARASS